MLFGEDGGRSDVRDRRLERIVRFNDRDLRAKSATPLRGRVNFGRSAATSRSNPFWAQMAANSSPMPDEAPVTIANGLLMRSPGQACRCSLPERPASSRL
jgi:hypothetical protein